MPMNDVSTTYKCGCGIAIFQLAFDATTESASWPETRNPLKDFDADFLDGNKKAERGFPRASGSAEWAFTKNPLLGFDGGFKASWNGWKVKHAPASSTAPGVCSTLPSRPQTQRRAAAEAARRSEPNPRAEQPCRLAVVDDKQHRKPPA
jgi:hypothetical protein